MHGIGFQLGRLFLVTLVVSTGAVVHCGDRPAADEEGSPRLPGFVVVLKGGGSLPVLTEPVIAFGKVRFQDIDGRTRVLAASKVDLGATREINQNVPSRRRAGTVSTAGGGGSEDPTPPREGVANTRSPSPQKVTVYSATWCPHCRTLEKFLADEGIRATVIMVDRMPEAEQQRLHAEMKRLTGRVAFPTVVIGNKARAGFSPDWILGTLGR